MRLYFLRHADALDGPNDAIRSLSPKGHQQCGRVGQFLKTAKIHFDAVYSSPLVRARETAELVLQKCGKVSADEVQLVDALLNETSARDFTGWLRSLPDAAHVLLVGHAPTLSERVRTLLDIDEPEALELPKAGLA